MIKGLCAMIDLYCGNDHENPIPFYMRDGAGMGRDSFYACPKYYPENRDKDERACNNNLTITDYLKMVNYLDKILTKAELDGEQLNLTNIKFKIGQVEFTVFEHSGKHIRISVVNKKAIKK